MGKQALKRDFSATNRQRKVLIRQQLRRIFHKKTPCKPLIDSQRLAVNRCHPSDCLRSFVDAAGEGIGPKAEHPEKCPRNFSTGSKTSQGGGCASLVGLGGGETNMTPSEQLVGTSFAAVEPRV